MWELSSRLSENTALPTYRPQINDRQERIFNKILKSLKVTLLNRPAGHILVVLTVYESQSNKVDSLNNERGVSHLKTQLKVKRFILLKPLINYKDQLAFPEGNLFSTH